jgi:hypothetical protein
MDPVPVEIALTGKGVGVVQPTTTTAIASSANPSVYGQATTRSAQPTAETPISLRATSSALSQVVNQASTSTTLTSSASSPILNTSITLTANLSVIAPGAGTPTGTITFQEGSNVLATSVNFGVR